MHEYAVYNHWASSILLKWDELAYWEQSAFWQQKNAEFALRQFLDYLLNIVGNATKLEMGLLNKSSRLAAALSETEFVAIINQSGHTLLWYLSPT